MKSCATSSPTVKRISLGTSFLGVSPAQVGAGRIRASRRYRYHLVWNFPFHNIFCPVIPALFAGNGVVIKVSEWTSWSAVPLVQIMRDILATHGHSPELVQLVTGYGDTGEALVGSGVDKIFFTGSPENGRKVMRKAAQTLTPVVLELGGKDAMIICEDADLDHAVSQAMLGVYTACGQMCVGAERLFVFDDIYDAFLAQVVHKVSQLKQAPPLQENADLGASTTPFQVERIEELVHDAVSQGARVLIGGKRNTELGGNFFEPTVLVDVTPSMRIMQEEHFGPVMVITRVKSDTEAIRLANDCPYGLGSSVFTRDPKRAEHFAKQIRAGMCVVNDYGLAYMIQSLPFGGIGISGFGRINGKEGLRACCNTKAIVTDRLSLPSGVSVYPVHEATFAVVENVIRLLYGHGLRHRSAAVMKTVRGLVSINRDGRGSQDNN
ncbi:MAG: aldehyde dehydrogenase family protein [Myxococcota bacterium]